MRPAPGLTRRPFLEGPAGGKFRTCSLTRGRAPGEPRACGPGGRDRSRRRRLRAPGRSVGTRGGGRAAGGARVAGGAGPPPGSSAPTSDPGDETAHCSRGPRAPPPWALLSVRLGHGWEAKNAGVQEPGSPPGLWPSAPGASGRLRLGGNADRRGQAAALSWVPAARWRRGSRTERKSGGRPAVSGAPGAGGAGCPVGSQEGAGWRAAGAWEVRAEVAGPGAQNPNSPPPSRFEATLGSQAWGHPGVLEPGWRGLALVPWSPGGGAQGRGEPPRVSSRSPPTSSWHPGPWWDAPGPRHLPGLPGVTPPPSSPQSRRPAWSASTTGSGLWTRTRKAT